MAGSSPPAWGTRGRPKWLGPPRRFIPTRVGNTRHGRRTERRPPVHPHPRGEHVFRCVARENRGGSSPPAWGTLAGREIGEALHRFIPTRVGNTGRRRFRQPAPPVHPHPRGEHVFRCVARENRGGSSPPAWGTLAGREIGEALHRFIPTRVGNTGRRRFRQPAPPVHPHPRGEHAAGSGKCPLPAGSSPPAWGTRAPRSNRVAGRRFIPTRVGNTFQPRGGIARLAVHPHPRGEHPPCPNNSQAVTGSSPPAWGTRERSRLRRGD